MRETVARSKFVSPFGVYRAWCGTYQPDLVVQSAFDGHLQELFRDKSHSIFLSKFAYKFKSGDEHYLLDSPN